MTEKRKHTGIFAGALILLGAGVFYYIQELNHAGWGPAVLSDLWPTFFCAFAGWTLIFTSLLCAYRRGEKTRGTLAGVVLSGVLTAFYAFGALMCYLCEVVKATWFYDTYRRRMNTAQGTLPAFDVALDYAQKICEFAAAIVGVVVLAISLYRCISQVQESKRKARLLRFMKVYVVLETVAWVIYSAVSDNLSVYLALGQGYVLVQLGIALVMLAVYVVFIIVLGRTDCKRETEKGKMTKEKKIACICLTVLTLCAVVVSWLGYTGIIGGGDVSGVQISEGESSEKYSESDIEAAYREVKAYFRKNFPGCTLTEMYYAGDVLSKAWIDAAIQLDANESIVIEGSFDVDASGGDGSLSPNETYSEWEWVLVRSDGGKWEVATNGY